jgi:uncharacterized membrane protein
MSALAISVAVICQLCLVTGQLLLKRAMSTTPVRYGYLAAAIALLATWFFLWLGLLSQWELSHIFPFEGLNPAMLVLGAALILKERVPLQAWAGVALISLGVALVA